MEQRAQPITPGVHWSWNIMADWYHARAWSRSYETLQMGGALICRLCPSLLCRLCRFLTRNIRLYNRGAHRCWKGAPERWMYLHKARGWASYGMTETTTEKSSICLPLTKTFSSPLPNFTVFPLPCPFSFSQDIHRLQTRLKSQFTCNQFLNRYGYFKYKHTTKLTNKECHKHLEVQDDH